jgi:hypothetical protein
MKSRKIEEYLNILFIVIMLRMFLPLAANGQEQDTQG